MTKLLSIIIPTYNMAALLPRCLQSLVDAKDAAQLDIIVVNDGSKDNSLDVAREWESKYPDCIRVIDKSNGNYGSTINAALPTAKGKYVKVLDSDDWFDTKALNAFLTVLSQTESDIVVTHFSQIGATQTEVVRYNTMGREPYEYGKVYDLDNVLKDHYIRFFLMHALTYRTQLLLQMNYRQTEGISYTDTEWACYPTFYANTIVFYDINLYQYNLDREGQTMDPNVLFRCVNQLQKVTDTMLEFYIQHIDKVSPTRQEWLHQYYENRLRILYKIYLLDMPRKHFDSTALQAMDDKYWSMCQTHNFHPRLFPENKLLRIDYIAYWHKHKKRWPLWFERFNYGVDVVMKWLYLNLFRK